MPLLEDLPAHLRPGERVVGCAWRVGPDGGNQLWLRVEPGQTSERPMNENANAKCKGCGAAIRWVTTVKSKHVPLDPGLRWVAPTGSGKRLMLFQMDGTTVQGFEAKANTPGAQGGYVSHWGTCPKRKDFGRSAARKTEQAAALDTTQKPAPPADGQLELF